MPRKTQRKSNRKVPYQGETRELSENEKELHEDLEKGWEKSNAKACLYALIMAGKIPLEAPDDEGIEKIEYYFNLWVEVSNYGGSDDSYKAFKRCLGNLQKDIMKQKHRAAADQEAFDIFAKTIQRQKFVQKGVTQNGKDPMHRKS